MQYTIVGLESYRMKECQINRLCNKLGVTFVCLEVETENDRNPLHWIRVESQKLLLLGRVKEIFGSEYEVVKYAT